MNLIRATGKLLAKSRPNFKFRPSVRGAQYLDQDWMPGPYPKTEEERLAAAKKYNLLPEEYEAYDPEKWEFAYGDYPKLPNINFHMKNPYYAYDYMSGYHNYGETVHVNREAYGPLGFKFEPPFGIKFWEVVVIYTGAIGFVVIWNYLNHYTFEVITVFKNRHRIFPGETYYHYPNSDLKVYEW